MRGRLINPFLLQLAQLDTLTSNADPDGAGPLTSGFDPDFREPLVFTDGTTGLKYKAPIFLPTQVEVNAYEQLVQQNAGNDPNATISFVFHFIDLEQAGMLDDNGNATIRIGDKAMGIYRYRDESLIMNLGLDGNGLFCTEAQPRSFGLSSGERNILVATFASRDKTYRGT